MQVSKISFNPNFTGKKDKTSPIKAGTAALIILAAPVSAQVQTPEDFFKKADEKEHVMVPQCFIYGVTKKRTTNNDINFAEIDSVGYRDSILRKYEVLDAERAYYQNQYRREPSYARERYTQDLFDRLAKGYNKDNDPNSISYQEFQDIMKAYKKSRE